MKKIFLALTLNILIILPSFAIKDGVNYDLIYQNLPQIKNEYIFNEDPEEIDDYKDFSRSPYPLLRTWSEMYCQKSKIPDGYYLLTPRSIDDYAVVLFKQNGKVAFIVPAYEKVMIDPLIVYKEPPKPPTPWFKKPAELLKSGMLKLLGNNKKPPEQPKSLINAFSVGGAYYKIDFYYKEYLYRMLFRTEK